MASTLGGLQDYSRLHDRWGSLLGPHVPDLGQIYSTTARVFPDRNRVFRAFSATPFGQVRVVLLGQDPYDTVGRADGLAFSQPGGVAKRSALHRLFLNLERDPNIAFSRPRSGDLTKWAEKGVLLLNAALTVAERVPRSHLAFWQPFTREVLRSVSSANSRAVFVLLGGDAVKLALPELQGVPDRRIIRAAHPMAGNSGGERPFHSVRVFSEVNSVLPANATVDWSL
ncbi:uracil-DNA glycosylase [Demequina sp. NBRC 110056]|uniref:uracil-DNA glycosylase n=1 Tax=Demequina sp. NBRC 110056 TaxID=1570345 RepID=UPI0009FC1390